MVVILKYDTIRCVLSGKTFAGLCPGILPVMPPLARFRPPSQKHKQFNVVSSAVLWGLWNFRNSIVFNRRSWISIKQVLGLVYRYLRDWTKLFQDLQGGKMQEFQELIWERLRKPLMLEPG